jgi:phosphoglucosamine mutase
MPGVKRLFGTDGVRGVANRDLSPELALALGRAAGTLLASDGGEVVVGRDTRLSGPMLEGALTAGLCSAGATVRLAGVVPTPAVAFLTVDEKARAGAVISASHNPVPDNGIKFFSDEGLKIADEVEERIEELMQEPLDDLPAGEAIGRAEALPGGLDRYVRHLLGTIEHPLTGLRVVLDCAHGAAHAAGPRAFREAGADVIAIHTDPDGSRINVDCGSTSLNELSAAVVAEAADLGLAFDGDADRVLAVDEAGRPVDGDRIIALAAIRLHERGALTNGTVVATVMANLGFVKALETRGIEVVAAPVGDRYVAEAMAEHGAALGGEQSGHVIFGEHTTTGDGILTGLQLASALVSSDEVMSSLVDLFEPYPQVLINVPVAARGSLEDSAALWDEVRTAERSLGDGGRVLIRPSGTEPLVRVMVEATDRRAAQVTARSLADAVKRHLG